MAVCEIPTQFIAECDGCRTTVAMTSKGRPAHWADLIIAQDAYDYQGAAVADGTVRRLLCRECTNKAAAAINAALSPQEPDNG